MSDPLTTGTPVDDTGTTVTLDTEETVRAIGHRIRELRQARNLTLGAVAERTGLSVSLLSMVERGRTGPSIGTLVAISGALGVHMPDLFDRRSVSGPPDPVRRRDHQPTYETAEGVTRRVVHTDDAQGFEMAVNEYAPGTSSSPTPVHHDGHEFGLVLGGTLTVELDGRSHTVRPGDAISYDSRIPHRLINGSRRQTRALWVNLDR